MQIFEGAAGQFKGALGSWLQLILSPVLDVILLIYKHKPQNYIKMKVKGGFLNCMFLAMVVFKIKK